METLKTAVVVEVAEALEAAYYNELAEQYEGERSGPTTYELMEAAHYNQMAEDFGF